MKSIPEKEIRKVLSDLPAEDVEAVLALVKTLRQKRNNKTSMKTDLSKAEHRRIISVLDAVAGLSLEKGPAVSNREHDQYLYGG